MQRNAQTCATKKTRTQKISDHSKRKNAKQIVALSYAQLESKPQIKNNYYGRATQRANLSHKEDPNATRPGFSCRCEAKLRARDSKKRRRYATRADRLVLRQSVRRIESMAPSASLILLTLRFDRQVTASSANADRATKHFRYQKPFF